MVSKIAYITDLHLDEAFPLQQGVDPRAHWNMILDDLTKRGITSVIFGGDIGEKSSNRYFFDSLASFQLSISLGNHDDFSEVIQHYTTKNIVGDTAFYYSEETPFYKFIYLDSSQNTIENTQYQWFLHELQTDKTIVIFVHHPILPVNVEVDRKYYLIHRDRFRIALEQLPNDVLLFSGHYHFNATQTHKNITQYITQAASYQIANIPKGIKINTDTFGYRILEFFPDEVKTTLITFQTDTLV